MAKTSKKGASALTTLKRKLAATKKKLAATVARLRKANGKAKPKTAKPKRPARPRPSAKGEIRHDLGKAQLRWKSWESLGIDRYARFATGLNGENKGAMVLVLYAERQGGDWNWGWYPKNDYGDLLPEKFAQTFEAKAATKELAKLAADRAVGLA